MLGRSGDGSRVEADWTDLKECGDTGGVGGSRNASGTAKVLVDVALEACVLCELGVAGGERGSVMAGVATFKLCVGGGRYVIPIAACRPTRSRFSCGMKATVTSPAWPPGAAGGTGIRRTDSLPVGLGSSHRSIVRILSWSKYFQLRIKRAAVGSARMRVLLPLAGSCLSVASLQWSLLCWEIMTRSGGDGSSESEDMHAGCL